MMNELLNTMASDMSVFRYRKETDESYIYRLCYSALGQWCLATAKNSAEGKIGTTKHNQTIVLNELLLRFTELFPRIADWFVDASNQQTNFSVSVRKVYEETGYLLTDSDNRNSLANFGRTVRVGSKSLFFGLPNEPYEVNGFGVFADSTVYEICLRDFLIRDKLTAEDYFETRYDPLDYYNRDIDLSELEFFNPKSFNVPSMSWRKKLETTCTVARKSETGPFYRIMTIAGDVQFADEQIEQQTDKFTSYEYRRLYFALKAHYGTPLIATITKLDEVYSQIRIGGHLPNREYYLLLLSSWPDGNAFNKVKFIIRNELISGVIDALTNIGVRIKGGQVNA